MDRQTAWATYMALCSCAANLRGIASSMREHDADTADAIERTAGRVLAEWLAIPKQPGAADVPDVADVISGAQ